MCVCLKFNGHNLWPLSLVDKNKFSFFQFQAKTYKKTCALNRASNAPSLPDPLAPTRVYILSIVASCFSIHSNGSDCGWHVAHVCVDADLL